MGKRYRDNETTNRRHDQIFEAYERVLNNTPLQFRQSTAKMMFYKQVAEEMNYSPEHVRKVISNKLRQRA